jgi:hypothetical protein
MNEQAAPGGSEATPPAPARGWSRPKKVAVGCGGTLALLLLGSCIFTGLTIKHASSLTLIEGERFYPRGASAPANLVVARVDLADPGVAECFPVIVRSALRGSHDDDMPEALRSFNDFSQAQNANNMTYYLPITATVMWDEAPTTSASTDEAGAPPARPGHAVVIQYKGMASLFARALGSFVTRAAGSGTLEHGGVRFTAAPPDAQDPDVRDLFSVQDRFIATNKVSLARDLVDAASGPEAPADPADPRALLDLLPKTRDLYGLHVGASAARMIDRALEQRRYALAAAAGEPVDTTAPLPELPFDETKLDALAWSVDVGAGDTARTDCVLRFSDEGAAALAAKTLDSPDTPARRWPKDLHVPGDAPKVALVGPRTVQVTYEGKGAAAAIQAFFDDSRRSPAAARRGTPVPGGH